MEDLESVQAELESREETLIRQEDLYIASKKALELERSEMESLCKEQQDHAITKKSNNALKKKYCDLDEKHKKLELQYGILWDSNSHPSKAKETSTPSTANPISFDHSNMAKITASSDFAIQDIFQLFEL